WHLAPQGIRPGHRRGIGRPLQDPLQGRLLSDAETSSAHKRGRPNREHFIGPDPFHGTGNSCLRIHEAAVQALHRYLEKVLGRLAIAVNAGGPGAIAKDFSGGMVRDNPEVNKRVADMTALGRAGQPDDIGPMIAALLSEDNRWINAQRVEVSGGMAL